MIYFFRRILRSFYFRATATIFVVLLLVFLSNFLITVYRANILLGTELGPEWKPVLLHLEDAYFYGLWSLGVLSFIVIAAILDLFVYKRTAAQFREVSRSIVRFANGNLHLRVEQSSEGPMGELQVAFNKMADTIVENLTRLEDSNQLRRELVANVAHDLGGPVTSILGYIDTIRLKAHQIPRDQLLEYLEVARSNALFLSKLVGELSDLSRFDSEGVPFQPRQFDFKEIAEAVLNRFRAKVGSRGYSLVGEYLVDNTMVIADPVLIERVLTNLIENAVNYSPSGGQVRVVAEAKATRLSIRVCDRGIGIPDEDQPFIFERFYRVDKDRSRLTGGSGLGLAIVKKALDLHESEIVLTSERGTGTEVQFYLYRQVEMDDEMKGVRPGSQIVEEDGATLVEYSLLVALIGLVVIAAMTNFQLAVSKQYSLVEGAIAP